MCKFNNIEPGKVLCVKKPFILRKYEHYNKTMWRPKKKWTHKKNVIAHIGSLLTFCHITYDDPINEGDDYIPSGFEFYYNKQYYYVRFPFDLDEYFI